MAGRLHRWKEVTNKGITIGLGKFPQEMLIKTQLGLSVETESTLSAAQLARLYSFSLIWNSQERSQTENQWSRPMSKLNATILLTLLSNICLCDEERTALIDSSS